MFGWLTRSYRRARRAHEGLWAPERVIGADGLSIFQRRAEAELTTAGYTLRERVVAPLRGGAPTDLYITGSVGHPGARVYLYQDGVEVCLGKEVLRLEDWDVEGPDQMIRKLMETLATLDAREV